VPLFLNRQCDRTLGRARRRGRGPRQGPAVRAGGRGRALRAGRVAARHAEPAGRVIPDCHPSEGSAGIWVLL
jgi:hypothetical protein